jgi:pimeloyl-ACP methyl ester carboxylesterase
MPYAQADGARLYYQTMGKGFPIVFAHEFSGDYRSWENQLRYFSRRYQCTAYNARGFPPSDVPDGPEAYSQAIFVEDMAQVLRHLGIERAHIVGLSMGSMTTLHFGLRYPDAARSMVLAGTGPGEAEGTKRAFDAEIRELIKAIETVGWAKLAPEYWLADDRSQIRAKNPRGYNEFIGWLSERSAHDSVKVLRGVILGRPLLRDLETDLRRLAVPTLIATGDEDHVCIETSLFLKRILPLAGLHVFPKTGHTVNLEEPDAFNHAVERFFAAVEAGGWSPTPTASRTRYP